MNLRRTILYPMPSMEACERDLATMDLGDELSLPLSRRIETIINGSPSVPEDDDDDDDEDGHDDQMLELDEDDNESDEGDIDYVFIYDEVMKRVPVDQDATVRRWRGFVRVGVQLMDEHAYTDQQRDVWWDTIRALLPLSILQRIKRGATTTEDIQRCTAYLDRRQDSEEGRDVFAYALSPRRLTEPDFVDDAKCYLRELLGRVYYDGWTRISRQISDVFPSDLIVNGVPMEVDVRLALLNYDASDMQLTLLSIEDALFGIIDNAVAAHATTTR